MFIHLGVGVYITTVVASFGL